MPGRKLSRLPYEEKRQVRGIPRLLRIPSVQVFLLGGRLNGPPDASVYDREARSRTSGRKGEEGLYGRDRWRLARCSRIQRAGVLLIYPGHTDSARRRSTSSRAAAMFALQASKSTIMLRGTYASSRDKSAPESAFHICSSPLSM